LLNERPAERVATDVDCFYRRLMKNIVAPTFRLARTELKLSATICHQPGQRPRGHFSSTCYARAPRPRTKCTIKEMAATMSSR
jgi:hypothetical protein